MISPTRLSSRALTIMTACGGEPTRGARINPTPRTRAALEAWHVGWYLVHARDAMVYLHHPRPRDVASMRWRYRAYAGKRENAKYCIEFAARHLAAAERIYAGLAVCASFAAELRADAALVGECV